MTAQEHADLIVRLREGRVKSGIANCHHRGLHSIVLDQREDGSLLRIFYADMGHRMDRLFDAAGHFVLGAHNHDKALHFNALFGRVWNVEVLANIPPGHCTPLYRFGFTSALINGSFALGKPIRQHCAIEIRELDGRTMEPEDIHTVMVSTSRAAWLVDEGPTLAIQKYIYSPRPDLSLEIDGLYLPMPEPVLHATCEVIANAMEAEAA